MGQGCHHQCECSRQSLGLCTAHSPAPHHNHYGQCRECQEPILKAWLIFLLLSHSIMSDSLRSHGLQPIRHLCSWGFSRQEDWSGLPFPPPGDLPKPGVEPRSPALQVDCVPSKPPATMEGLILYSSLKFGHWPQSSGLVASSAFSEGLEPLV